MPHIHRRNVLATALSVALAGPAFASPSLGQPAPAFQAVDASGKTRSLSEFAGKTVVLEWTNNGCPYVQKHYGYAAQWFAIAAGIAILYVWHRFIRPGKP